MAAPGLMETAIQRVHSGSESEDRADLLAIEEPLEIRIGFHQGGKLTHKAISITMRTPGEDAELAAGFLFTEGIISGPDQIKQIRHCGMDGVPALAGRESGKKPTKAGTPNSNTIRVGLAAGVDIDLKRLKRHFYTTSSCGVCGKSSIEALQSGAQKLEGGFRVSSDLVHTLPEILRSEQDVFDRTGGLHASALFDAEGKLDIVREDVGRHNALDKVIGAKLLENKVPLSESVLIVSGRTSFELVQKALMAGIPILAAVGAPSSLAVELAREFGMTLIGFVRDERFNIYAGPERILSA